MSTALLTTDEAAARLRKNPWWVRTECRAGRLRAFRYGNTWHIPEDAITAYLEERSNAAPSPAPTARRRRRRRSA